MNAILVREFGAPEVLKLEEILTRSLPRDKPSSASKPRA
jgi:hypothetical protein